MENRSAKEGGRKRIEALIYGVGNPPFADSMYSMRLFMLG